VYWWCAGGVLLLFEVRNLDGVAQFVAKGRRVFPQGTWSRSCSFAYMVYDVCSFNTLGPHKTVALTITGFHSQDERWGRVLRWPHFVFASKSVAFSS
jgi:hypothetical protein